MRLLGILLLSLTPLLFGLDYQSSLKKRRDLFLKLKAFVVFIKEQIRFCGRERDEIFAISDSVLEFNDNFLKTVKLCLKNGENLTKTLNNYTDIRLKSKEITEINAFFTELGKTDTEGQINHCDYYINLFEQAGKSLSDTYHTKSRLTLGLSLSLTAAMFIIMV